MYVFVYSFQNQSKQNFTLDCILLSVKVNNRFVDDSKMRNDEETHVVILTGGGVETDVYPRLQRHSQLV